MKSLTITLCGSARFEEHWKVWNKVLSLSGHTVFSLACMPSDNGGKDWYTPEQKRRLDAVHKLKIQRSDAIAVLNVDGYVGESTLSEIEHARLLDKRIYALQSWGAHKPWCSVGMPSFWDLLPEAGQYRNSLVDLVRTTDA